MYNKMLKDRIEAHFLFLEKLKNIRNNNTVVLAASHSKKS